MAEDSNGQAPKDTGDLKQVFDRLTVGDQHVAHTSKSQRKERYAFWETQPVAQFETKPGASDDIEEGPIDAPKTVADVRQEPYNLPASFEWCDCDMLDDGVAKEVYELLTLNYVEDDDGMFRFNYSKEFLQWALQPPGYRKDWHVGVRVSATRKLVGFISAIPATMRVDTSVVPLVEINFLCVHRKLRSKRLAPVLIKEITRRVNLQNIWQAAYTAGVVLPTPVATCRYWHRSLNPKKLIEVEFSRLMPRMTMARTIKLYKVADAPRTRGIRVMRSSDAPQVATLLNNYLARYRLAPTFTEEEVLHWLVPRDEVVDAWVVENDGKVTDLISFYNLPSSVLQHPVHKSLKAAFMYYTVPGSVPIKQLMEDALVLANSKHYDVFNALDILENRAFLQDLKFGIGDGNLQYYLYNWRVKHTLAPEHVGLVLL